MKLHNAADADPGELAAFLERSFGPAKAGFLAEHGDWWHGGPDHRWTAEADGRIAGYSSVIPARVLVDGRPREALWWTDLVVAPEFRGRGLQTLMDREVRSRTDLTLGFPNLLAAGIHLRHGWGVRDDLRVLLAPLVPSRLPAVTRARGGRGAALRAAALTLAPWKALWRRRLARDEPRGARRLAEPDAAPLAVLARRTPGVFTTTLRDAAHFEHRYLEAPYRDEIAIYAAGDVVLVTRRLRRAGRVVERILDLFGDLDDRAALRDALRLALGDAVRAGAVQVTALASHPALVRELRKNGFWLSSTARFCWWSPHDELRTALGRRPCHWCLGDSDHDTIE